MYCGTELQVCCNGQVVQQLGIGRTEEGVQLARSLGALRWCRVLLGQLRLGSPAQRRI